MKISAKARSIGGVTHPIMVMMDDENGLEVEVLTIKQAEKLITQLQNAVTTIKRKDIEEISK